MFLESSGKVLISIKLGPKPAQTVQYFFVICSLLQVKHFKYVLIVILVIICFRSKLILYQSAYYYGGLSVVPTVIFSKSFRNPIFNNVTFEGNIEVQSPEINFA